MDLIIAERWRLRAACHGSRVTFFPEAADVQGQRTAKAICRHCPVREDCLNYALANDLWPGIWGGLSERERRKVLRARRQAAQLPARAVR